MTSSEDKSAALLKDFNYNNCFWNSSHTVCKIEYEDERENEEEQKAIKELVENENRSLTGVPKSDSPSLELSKPIKAGLLTNLVELLTEPDIDQSFVVEFILTYRSFPTKMLTKNHTDTAKRLQPIELLELLLLRYMGPPEDVSKRDYTSIRKSILKVMITWIMLAPRDWVEDDNLLQRHLLHFVGYRDSNGDEGRALFKQVMDFAKKRTDSIPSTTHHHHHNNNHNHQKHAKQQRSSILTDFSSEDLAIELTLIEYDMAKNIQPKEFLKQAWIKKDGDKNAPNIKAHLSWFNQTAQWICSEILKKETPEERGANIAKFIEIALYFRALNNFGGIMEVLCALNNSSILRLKQSWEHVPDHLNEAFEHINLLMEPNYRFSKYRAALMEAIQSGYTAIPFFGVALSDFTFFDDGNPDTFPAKHLPSLELINFMKATMMGQELYKYHRSLSHPYAESLWDINSMLWNHLKTQIAESPSDDFYIDGKLFKRNGKIVFTKGHTSSTEGSERVLRSNPDIRSYIMGCFENWEEEDIRRLSDLREPSQRVPHSPATNHHHHSSLSLNAMVGSPNASLADRRKRTTASALSFIQIPQNDSSSSSDTLQSLELTDRDWKLILSCSSVLELDEGDVIVEEGLINNCMYRVKRGTVRVEKKSTHPHSNSVDGHVKEDVTVIKSLQEGAIFGEMSFLMLRSTASIIAHSPKVIVHAIPRDLLEVLLDTEPIVSKRFYFYLAKKVAERLEKLPTIDLNEEKEIILSRSRSQSQASGEGSSESPQSTSEISESRGASFSSEGTMDLEEVKQNLSRNLLPKLMKSMHIEEQTPESPNDSSEKYKLAEKITATLAEKIIVPKDNHNRRHSASPRNSTDSSVSDAESMPSYLSARDIHVIRTFKLDNDQVILKEYFCTMKKSLSSMHGSLFVTRSYVCYQANVFGYSTKKLIPIHEISSIESKGNKLKIRYRDKKVSCELLEADISEAEGILKGLWILQGQSEDFPAFKRENSVSSSSFHLKKRGGSKSKESSLDKNEQKILSHARFNELYALYEGSRSKLPTRRNSNPSVNVLKYGLRRTGSTLEGSVMEQLFPTEVSSERARHESHVLTMEDWQRLTGGTKVLTFKRNEVIIESGQPYYKLYQIVQGRCRVERDGHVIGNMIQPEVFGELNFLLNYPDTTGKTRTPTSCVYADEDQVQVLKVEGYYLHILLQAATATQARSGADPTANMAGFAGRFFKYLGAVISRRIYSRERLIYHV